MVDWPALPPRLLGPSPRTPMYQLTNYRRDAGAEFGLTLRGLLGMIVQTIAVVPCREPSYLPRFEVIMLVRVPDRDDATRTIEINFADEFMAVYHHLDRKMTAEQSCILQAIRVLWDHELGESVLVNGEVVWDPEPAHQGA
jgi:hypothetical protein